MGNTIRLWFNLYSCFSQIAAMETKKKRTGRAEGENKNTRDIGLLDSLYWLCGT